MNLKTKGPAGHGASKSSQHHPTKTFRPIQVQTLWTAYTQCVKRLEDEPTLEDHLTAKVMAAFWKRSFLRTEVSHD